MTDAVQLPHAAPDRTRMAHCRPARRQRWFRPAWFRPAWARASMALALAGAGLPPIPALAEVLSTRLPCTQPASTQPPSTQPEQPGSPHPGPTAEAAPAPVIRVTEEADGAIVRLELAVRELVHPEAGRPRVLLAGAVHIADRTFYDRLQRLLDEQDVVLFEGVKPPGAGRDEHSALSTDEDRAELTEHRLRFLATAVEIHHRSTGDYPVTLAELDGSLDRRLAELVRGGLADGWGRPIDYVPPAVEGGRYDLVSLGADGVAGGSGPGADLAFSTQEPITREERGEGDGIQQQLADAFGLVFQKDAIDWSRPNWRNSDLSIDQVMDRLGDGDGAPLFEVLDGSSISARLGGVLLRLVGLSVTLQTSGKLMMMEMLSRADELLAAAPGDLGDLMDVLIADRNAVVVGDLARLIDAEPGVETVAIWYGAGHLPDLERRLADELGYRPAGDTWIPAITVDVREIGLTGRDATMLRTTVRRALEQQLRTMRRDR